jgi:hypothetical protein
MDTLLPGISAERVPTSRLTVNVLPVPGRTGPPVVFVRRGRGLTSGSREGGVTSAPGARHTGQHEPGK